ncbi:MAG: hypothetical protein ACQKBU_06380 [Verrucomicrobiales bacterium]
METPDQIESKLEKLLVPRGFSEQGAASIETLFDDLAGEGELVHDVSTKRARGWWWLGSAAAGVCLALKLTVSAPSSELFVERVPEVDYVEPVALVSESEGVVSAEPELDYVTDAEGNLMQAWNVQVVSEEKFHDPETGYEVRVVCPREEILLMPVSSF